MSPSAPFLVVRLGLDFPALDVLHFHIAVLLLTHDEKLLAVEVGLFLQREERFLRLVAVELDKDTPLEYLLGISAAQTDGIRRSIWCEEGFNVELCTWTFLAETLGIDATGQRFVFDELDIVRCLLAKALREWNLPSDLFIVHDFEQSALPQSSDDRGEGLEMAHALEAVDDFDGDGIVLAAANLGEEEIV